MDRYEGRRVSGGDGSGRPKGRKTVKPSRFTKKQKGLIVGGSVLAVILLVTLGLGLLFVRPDLPGEKGQLPSTSETEGIDYGDGVRPRAGGERKSKDFYTILILGRDTGGGGNTDTMLLASYDVTNQKATVMSIPRDTMVNVNWDVKKINSVYNMHGGGAKGINALYKEISQLVGFEPDYEVVVEWEAIGAIVEAMGGVYFDVPYNMDYDDALQDLAIHQEKGYRLLSGDDAMEVIRWRKNNRGSPYGYTTGVGDSGRMKIQQDFLKVIIQQLLQVKNVANINKLAKVFQDNVETDLSLQNVFWFGKQAVFGGLSTENVNFVTMPFQGASAWSRYYKDSLSYVVPMAGELLDVVNNQLSPFVELFALRDLDIMSVNADGSLSSTSGSVEDKQAARPPVKPTPLPEEPAVLPEVPENGTTLPGDGTTLPGDGTTLPGDGTTTNPGDGTTPPDSGAGTITPPGDGTISNPGDGSATVPPVVPVDPGAQDPIITTPEPPPDELGGLAY